MNPGDVKDEAVHTAKMAGLIGLGILGFGAVFAAMRAVTGGR